MTDVSIDIVAGPPASGGLSVAEAAKRLSSGEGNRPSTGHSRTGWQIVHANVFTRFNAVLGGLLAVILLLGPLIDGLFGIILVANALIGIVQEVRAKHTLERLSVITATKAVVVRDGRQVEIDPADVVRGDLVGLRSGAQIVVDGPLEVSDGLEVDESLLTGEGEAQLKVVGDVLRSGSFVAAGTGWLRADKVGDLSFANALSAEAQKFAPVKSELRVATDKVLRIVTWAIGPIAFALLVGQRLGGETWKQAIFGAATGVVEIVPEGFVLLTSMTLAMSVVRLGRAGILVKELAAVEGLARVDTVCFDKTGTLTEGKPVVKEIVALNGIEQAQLEGALLALTAGSSDATGLAIRNAISTHTTDHVVGRLIPFSSARKWAALSGEGSHPGGWVLGAPEILFDKTESGEAVSGQIHSALEEVGARTAQGQRVLLLGMSDSSLTSDSLPLGLRPVALIALTERIRKDAAQTMRYFADQQVSVKVISGDNPVTVGAVARAAGMTGLDDPGAVVDARSLHRSETGGSVGGDDAALIGMIAAARVVGRSTPQQKEAMVAALQSQGRTVAMTGDGVNDALALKAADLGIAMGSGSEATKAVAQLILVGGDFAAIPRVVGEGRRVIANVERVAKLFITKTVYAAALAVATGVARLPFPFLPRQLTLVSALTIGIPGFFLAFAPEAPRTEPGFMHRVAVFSIPAGLIAAIATFTAYATALLGNEVSVRQARTNATLVLGLVGLWVVSVIARPLSGWRRVLLTVMATFGAVSCGIRPVRRFWELSFPPPVVLGEAALIAVAAIAVIEGGWRFGMQLKRTHNATGRRFGLASR